VPDGDAAACGPLRGELFDVSADGAGVRVDNRRGYLDPDAANGAEVQIEVPAPDGGSPIVLDGTVRWCESHGTARRRVVRIGIEFRQAGSPEACALSQLAAQGKGDQQFLWNLWEAYEQCRNQSRHAA
jgi:hypothetical protein